jgi:hypothetical protein
MSAKRQRRDDQSGIATRQSGSLPSKPAAGSSVRSKLDDQADPSIGRSLSFPPGKLHFRAKEVRSRETASIRGVSWAKHRRGLDRHAWRFAQTIYLL